MFDGYVLSVCMRNVQEYVQRSVWVCLGERKSMCGAAALWTGRWLRTAAAVVCARRFRSLPRGSPGSRVEMTVGVSTEGMRCGGLVRDEYVDL